jgi:hypothetical protein
MNTKLFELDFADKVPCEAADSNRAGCDVEVVSAAGEVLLLLFLAWDSDRPTEPFESTLSSLRVSTSQRIVTSLQFRAIGKCWMLVSPATR